jgi:hypothetical protein
MQAPYFFEGIVAEDPTSELGLSADGPQIGRVLVRELLGHSNQVSSEDLLPARIIMPPTSAGTAGIGLSPTGLLKGTSVMCMKFPDENTSYVIGVLNYAAEGNHSVSSYARGQGEPEEKTQNRIKKDDGFEIEPASKYKAKYPYNNTITTRSGHLVELDDTPGSERVQVYHKSGSYLEILPDGTIVTKSVKDYVQLAAGNMTIFNVGGSEGFNKNIEITCNQGKITIIAQSDVDIFANEGNVGIYANNGSVQIVSQSGAVDIKAAIVGVNA